ncbi:hypothetical protein HPB50_027187 [Hyalomma asiaticum]|uniref:Uncharacterized protein n=1 Tax=Hyalomma asiaticum TaxID=266040 RepID=A0ACB7TTZ8_HYAAI|nr:hypothetical protein HPB50_027187 [Hyalomma asiaticum]
MAWFGDLFIESGMVFRALPQGKLLKVVDILLILRPPPPASQALEPRCAWNGDNFRTRPQGNGLLALSDERSSSGWELSDRALDPYTYARRWPCAADGRGSGIGWHSSTFEPSAALQFAISTELTVLISAATVASHKKQSSSRVLRKARLLRATTRYEQGCGDNGDHRSEGDKKQRRKTAKQFPVRSGGSGLGKFWKLGDTSVPLPSPHHRNPVIPGGAELRRPLFDRRPCPHTFTAQQPLCPVHIARASSALCPASMPDNGASRKVKRRWYVPRHTTIGPSCKANGRSFKHHQPPAAPNVSRAQDQLRDSSSSSPGTPPWPATADDPATTAAEGSDGFLIDMDFGAFLEA